MKPLMPLMPFMCINRVAEAQRSLNLLVGLHMLLSAGIVLPIDAQAEPTYSRDDTLNPYPGTPPEVELTNAETAALESGEPVFTRVKTANGERSAIVFRVGAPQHLIWSVITTFSAYPKWIDGLAETEVYRREGSEVFVRFRTEQAFVGSYTYYVQHRLSLDESWITWQLDNNRKSDLDDTVGFWRITPVPGDLRQSDVTYSTEVRLKGWFARFFNRMLVNNTLRRASSWVKTQAELRVPASPSVQRRRFDDS